MVKNNIEYRIEQILVSFRSDDHGVAAMHSIVVLAEKLKAQLNALFIEDEDLLHLARLPFSREIILPTANVRNLDSDAMLRHIRNYAESLRNLMTQYAQASNVSCTFETRTGSVIELTLSESANAQLIIFMPKQSVYRGRKPAESLEQIINPALLFYDDTPQAQKAMLVIRSLIENNDLHQLKVLTTSQQQQASAMDFLHQFNIKVDYLHIDDYIISAITKLSVTGKPGLVILPLEQDLTQQTGDIKQLIDTLGSILLLVR